MVGENGSTIGVDVTAQLGAHTGAVEDIVAQNQCGRVSADVIRAEDEGLGEAVGDFLDGVRDVHAEL